MNDRYKTIEKAAGEGGYGRIDKCFDEHLKRDVAVKVLDPLFKNITETDIERFKREACSLAKLTHPNIPAIYDIQMDEEFRIIFQWIDGITIREYLRNFGTMALLETKKFFFNICHALKHMHDNEVLHRDIKPSNIIITQDMTSCYLVDLGISLNKDDIKRFTGSTPIGTPGYMSPEQQAGQELTPESDIYALGILLYECLSGSQPSPGDYNKLVDIDETIPPAIDDLIRKSLSRDKNQRPTSALAFYSLLEDSLHPRESFSKILTNGTLYEIQNHIMSMDGFKFSEIKFGQKKLLIIRLKDLINANHDRMRKAIASFLSSLLKHARSFEDNEFSYLIEKSFLYGLSVRYSERWRGNDALKKGLVELGASLSEKQLVEVAKIIVDTIEQNENYEKEERWYYHCLRDVLEQLLANPECPEETARHLADILEGLNRLSHNPSVMS